jgi:hypothetical protein
MSKKSVILSGVAVVLATLYIVNFTDWLKPKNIQIFWRISPTNPSLLAFYLDKAYPLTSVEVVTAEDARTNKYPHALWHLVAESNAAVTKTFNYGVSIPGMKPEIASAQAEPLMPDVDYCLIVQADGGVKSTRSFTVH